MKKISFLVANIYKFGGTQKINGIIANELLKKDIYNIEIVSLFKASNEVAVNINKNLVIKNIFDEPMSIKRNYVTLYKRVKFFFLENQTDIVVISGVGLLPVLYPAIRRLGIRIIAWDHQCFNPGRFGGLEWIGKRIAAKLCDSVVVITQKTFEEYKRNLNNNNMIMIYNPIEKLNSDFSIRYNLKSKKIITCGRLESEKGLDLLVEVAKKVFDKHQDWEWHIWGSGSQYEFLQEKIIELNLDKNIKLCGYTNEIIEKYKEYAIYVMTSRFEGFGMVLIEARLNKLPVVSFDCATGPGEVIDNNENGYLVDCFDIDKMADKINMLICETSIRKKFSDNANKNLEKFDLEKIILQWQEVIN